jgi:hypothetical protein
VWVRGYGLADSAKVQSAVGKNLNLKAVVAPNKKAAAEYYPALYWFSLLEMPPKSDFPARAPPAMASYPISNARANGSALLLTPTAAQAAIKWATRLRARSRKAS